VSLCCGLFAVSDKAGTVEGMTDANDAIETTTSSDNTTPTERSFKNTGLVVFSAQRVPYYDAVGPLVWPASPGTA
jgi:hypothetical protein